MNNELVYYYTLKSSDVQITLKEVYRYLGYGNVFPSDKVTALIESSIQAFNRAVSYKACYGKTKINIDEESETIDFGFMKVKSHSLVLNLRGCKSAYIFAATTGSMAERLIMKHSKVSALDGLVIDAIGSAAIEDFCNLFNKWLYDFTAAGGKYLRPRFSCGYGDFPLEHQPQILDFLNTSRRMGLNITENLMMTPAKSVTAVIGISDTPTECRIGCADCEKDDCSYRSE